MEKPWSGVGWIPSSGVSSGADFGCAFPSLGSAAAQGDRCH